jgi:hypothetical protein
MLHHHQDKPRGDTNAYVARSGRLHCRGHEVCPAARGTPIHSTKRRVQSLGARSGLMAMIPSIRTRIHRGNAPNLRVWVVRVVLQTIPVLPNRLRLSPRCLQALSGSLPRSWTDGGRTLRLMLYPCISQDLPHRHLILVRTFARKVIDPVRTLHVPCAGVGHAEDEQPSRQWLAPTSSAANSPAATR